MLSHSSADSGVKPLAITSPESRVSSPMSPHSIGTAAKPARPSKLKKGWTSDEILDDIIDLTGCDQLEQEVGRVRLNPSAFHANKQWMGNEAQLKPSPSEYIPQSKVHQELQFQNEPHVFPAWNRAPTGPNLRGGGEPLCNLVEQFPASISPQDSLTSDSWRDIEEARAINVSLPSPAIREITPFLEDDSISISNWVMGSSSHLSSQALRRLSEAPLIASPASGSPINTPDSGYLSIITGNSACSSPNAPDIHEIFADGFQVASAESVQTIASMAKEMAKERSRSRARSARPHRVRVSKQSNRQNSMLSSPELVDASGAESASEWDVVNLQPPIPSIEQATTYQTGSTSPRQTEAIPLFGDDIVTGEDSDAENNEESPSSRDPTPWPESWYEGGLEFGLSQFAARIMAECTNQPHDLQIHVAASNGSNGGAGQETSQNQADSDANQASHLALPLSNLSKKRSKSGGTGGDEPDEGSPNPKRRIVMGPPEENGNPGSFYACPYQKRYPMDSPFCGMPHGSRRGYGWNTISRVKQHLLESHGRDHHCSNCWKAYKKVSDAKTCHQKKNCLKRSSPPKLWLAETEAAQLRGERFPSRSDDAWYRIFGLLFPDKNEHGPDGYRAKYTPYYSKVEYPLPTQFPAFSNGTSPNSMWTPSSNSTQSTSLTPPDTDGGNTLASGRDAQDDTQLVNGSFSQLFNEEVLFSMAPGLNLSNGQASNPTPMSGSHIPSGDNSFGILTVDHGSYQAPVQNEMLRPSRGPETSCCCSLARKCATCRLKQRNSDLRAENEKLRATIERMRAALDRHDEFLQDIDDQKLLSDEMMGKLWCYQESTRIFLSSHK